MKCGFGSASDLRAFYSAILLCACLGAGLPANGQASSAIALTSTALKRQDFDGALQASAAGSNGDPG